MSCLGGGGTKREEKVNWDIQSFLTVDGLSRLTLLGFRHTAPRPPFSLSPRQAKRSGESEKERERDQKEKTTERKEGYKSETVSVDSDFYQGRQREAAAWIYMHCQGYEKGEGF